MFGRHDRHGVFCHVDPEFQAFFINVRKTGQKEIPFSMSDVEQDAIIPGFFQLGVDGLGHHVAWGEAFHGMVFFHERVAVFQLENPPLSAHRLADEERFGRRMEKAGRMKLNKLHVGDLCAGPVCHGNSIRRGDVGICRDQINFACAPGGQHDEFCPKRKDLTGWDIQHIGAEASVGLDPPAEGGRFHDQIYRNMVLEDSDPVIFCRHLM